MKYLVTGGGGFVGSSLVKRLLSEGHYVRSFDNGWRSRAVAQQNDNPRLNSFRGDIRSPNDVRKAVAGVDAVCHLAYINGTSHFYTMPELVLEVAVKGMINVLDACREFQIKELHLASSSEAYAKPGKVPTDESEPLKVPDVKNPRWSYGGGKIISELLALNFGRVHFDRVTIFRPHNVYGPNMGYEHVIPELIWRLRDLVRTQEKPKSVELPIQGSGQETRAYCYIDDAVDGIYRIITQGQHLEVYNVGVDRETSIATLALELGRFFDRAVNVTPSEVRPGSTPRRCPSIEKLRGLGYEAKITLQDGLRQTVAWYLDPRNISTHP